MSILHAYRKEFKSILSNLTLEPFYLQDQAYTGAGQDPVFVHEDKIKVTTGMSMEIREGVGKLRMAMHRYDPEVHEAGHVSRNLLDFMADRIIPNPTFYQDQDEELDTACQQQELPTAEKETLIVTFGGLGGASLPGDVNFTHHDNQFNGAPIYGDSGQASCQTDERKPTTDQPLHAIAIVMKSRSFRHHLYQAVTDTPSTRYNGPDAKMAAGGSTPPSPT